MLSNRSMPDNVLIPVLGYSDIARAIDWLTGAFGLAERWRVGNHRAQLAVGPHAAIALFEGGNGFDANGPDHLMVRVEDVDAHCATATAHGAEIVAPPADYPYGERQYSVRDFSGRAWVFTQSIADLAPEDWGGTSAAD